LIIDLVRFAYLSTCTLGWLTVANHRFATIERPWIHEPTGPGGRRRESCVPDGEYTVRPHTSSRFVDTYALVNPQLGVWYQPWELPVRQSWGRSAILIHAGNRVADVIGCIAVGLRHTAFSGEHAVLESQNALAQLRAMLGKDKHSIAIRPTRGTEE
jgi:hypothetical protein